MLKVSEKKLASTVIRSTIETAEVWRRKKAEQEANRRLDNADVEPGHHQDPNTNEIGTFQRIAFGSRLPPLTIESLELHVLGPELDPAFQNLTGKLSQALMHILQIPIQDRNQRITLAPTHEVRRHCQSYYLLFLIIDHTISIHQSAFASVVDWRWKENTICANPSFHNRPQYKYALLQVTPNNNKHLFVQLIRSFKVRYLGQTFSLALVLPFNVPCLQ